MQESGGEAPSLLRPDSAMHRMDGRAQLSQQQLQELAQVEEWVLHRPMAEVRRRWPGRGITGRPKLLASAAVCPWACLNVLLFLPTYPPPCSTPLPSCPLPQVHVVDAMARFGAISSSALDAYFAILQQGDAILVRLLMLCRPHAAPAHAALAPCCACGQRLPLQCHGSSAPADPLCTLRRVCCFTCLQVPTSQTDCYRVVQPAAVTAAAAAAVSAAPVAAPQGPTAVMQAAMQQLTIGAMDSQQGGLHEAPGSQVGCPAAAQDEACSRASGGTAAMLTLPADCCLGACASCPPSRPCCSAP